MKKSLIIALAVVAGAVFNTAEAAGKKKKDKKNDKAKVEVVELKNAADSLSYSAGMVRTEGLVNYLEQSFNVDTAYMDDFVKGYNDAMAKGFSESNKAYFAGQQIAQMVSLRIFPFLKDEFEGRPDSLSADMFNHGFINALKNDSSLMTAEVAKEYFNKVFREAVDQRNAANKKAGEKYLADYAKKEGVKTLPGSKVQYKVIKEGTGEKPQATSKVKVNYEGKLVDGTVFDSSYKRNKPAVFECNRVIPGWTQALTNMPVGSTWEIYIPYELGYGIRGAGEKIPPFSTLIFKVELLSIEK